MLTAYLLVRPGWWVSHLNKTGWRRVGSAALHLGMASLVLWGAWWLLEGADAGLSALTAVPYRRAMAPAGAVIFVAFLLAALLLADVACALAAEAIAWAMALLLLAHKIRTCATRLVARFDAATMTRAPFGPRNGPEEAQ